MLPAWFRHAYLEYHAEVRLRVKQASVLGEPWTRDGGIPQGCLLSMMCFVCPLAPVWARWGGLRPQLYADNLKCVASDLALVLTGYVRLVGQEPSPSKRVLRSTSREVGKDVRSWVLSGSGKMDW